MAAQPELQIVDEKIGGDPVKPLQQAAPVLRDPAAFASHDDDFMRREIEQAKPPIPIVAPAVSLSTAPLCHENIMGT